MLVPFVWMMSLSLKPPGEIFRASFSLLPEHWHAIENYTKALTEAPLPRYMLNGVIVCAAIVTLANPGLRALRLCAGQAAIQGPRHCCSRSSSSGFSCRIRCWRCRSSSSATSSACSIPTRALIFPFVVSPFGIFLFRQFFKTIPDDIVHAARLDGLSELAIVWRIMVPMALPAVIAFSIFSVVSHWNDLFWPLIAVRSESLMPPPLGIMAFGTRRPATTTARSWPRQLSLFFRSSSPSSPPNDGSSRD